MFHVLICRDTAVHMLKQPVDQVKIVNATATEYVVNVVVGEIVAVVGCVCLLEFHSCAPMFSKGFPTTTIPGAGEKPVGVRRSRFSPRQIGRTRVDLRGRVAAAVRAQHVASKPPVFSGP